MTWILLAAAFAIAPPAAPADPCRPADPQRAAERFADLDAYLAARAKAGHTDAPHYRRRADGRYVCVTYPRTGAVARSFSRQDLARAYGFAPRKS